MMRSGSSGPHERGAAVAVPIGHAEVSPQWHCTQTPLTTKEHCFCRSQQTLQQYLGVESVGALQDRVARESHGRWHQHVSVRSWNRVRSSVNSVDDAREAHCGDKGLEWMVLDIQKRLAQRPGDGHCACGLFQESHIAFKVQAMGEKASPPQLATVRHGTGSHVCISCRCQRASFGRNCSRHTQEED